jgi:hypothetical protein
MRKLICLSEGTPVFTSARAACAATRALHGVNGASELRKDTVARRVRYAAPVLAYELVEDRAAFGEPFERADLINAHEPAVTLDIGCEDRDKASADFRRV